MALETKQQAAWNLFGGLRLRRQRRRSASHSRHKSGLEYVCATIARFNSDIGRIINDTTVRISSTSTLEARYRYPRIFEILVSFHLPASLYFLQYIKSQFLRRGCQILAIVEESRSSSFSSRSSFKNFS